ncbi:hypothetical protein GIB67_025102, partial [Kingdonia uniflora]
KNHIEAPAIGAAPTIEPPVVGAPAIGSSSSTIGIRAVVVRVCSQLEEHGKMLLKLDDHGKMLHNQAVENLLQQVAPGEGLEVVKDLMVDDDVEVNLEVILSEYGGLLKWKKGDEKDDDDKKDVEEKVKSEEEQPQVPEEEDSKPPTAVVYYNGKKMYNMPMSVMGKYTTGGELKPPISACVHGSGKHPQVMPSTPRWAVANGAAAVPALLFPPPTTALDEHLVAGLPALEPYARLFHRYYVIATPSITQKLLLGLLEAPPSWASDALDAAVQLVELLRAAKEYASGMRLPRNWMHLHFLRAIGTAMSMRVGIAADTTAALLFRILQLQTQSSTSVLDKKLGISFKAVLAETQYSTSSFQQHHEHLRSVLLQHV